MCSFSISLLRCIPIRCWVPPISHAITLSDFPRANRLSSCFSRGLNITSQSSARSGGGAAFPFVWKCRSIPIADRRMTPEGRKIHRTDDGGKTALSWLSNLTYRVPPKSLICVNAAERLSISLGSMRTLFGRAAHTVALVIGHASNIFHNSRSSLSDTNRPPPVAPSEKPNAHDK